MANYPHPKKGEHKHTGGTNYKYTVRQDLAADRKAQADIRQDLAEKRSPAEQVARLDDRLGVGQGAVKERARLQKLIGAAPEAQEPAQASPKGKKTRKGGAKAATAA